MAFSVMTDTSGNLPTALLKERGIKAIAFPYMFAKKTLYCRDTDAFDAEDFYTAIKKGETVTTSQIPPQEYLEFFESTLKNEEDVLFVAMSSGISGSCGSAHVAASELMEKYPERKIEIIDTLGASLGEGLLALQAAELRDQGCSLEETAAGLR